MSTESLPVGRSAAHRLLFIDNIRWVMILLVVSMHAADTYSPFGSWYFVDRMPLSPPALLTFVGWQMYLQAFFMGLLFFIAGYFVPSSLKKKGSWKFARDRGFRLGLPVLLYMFVIGPITEYYFSHSWSSTEPTSFANEWVKHIQNGQVLQENGPLWFCLALLVFSLCYAAAQSARPETSEDRKPVPAPGNGALGCFALVMAASTFLVRLVLPPGTSFLNMHLGDFAQYILLFIAGTLAARGQWLHSLDYGSAMRWLLITLPVGFAGWITVLLVGGANTGNADAFAGGWHWQAAAMNLWESFTCVAISFGLLAFFQRSFNSQGRLAKFMSDNAFSVYVFHPPVVIAGARLLHMVMWQPLVKFACLTCIGIVASFGLSAAVFRRLPVVRRIL